MKKYCPECKTEFFNESNFCEDCGGSLVSTLFSIALQSGKVLRNRYRIESQIQNSGSTSIYKVWDLQLKKPWAMKVIMPFSDREEDEHLCQSCFTQEASVFSRIQHPNILPFIDYFSDGGKYYIVMDLIEGEDLEEKLANEGNPGLPEDEVKRIALLLLDALIYLHSQNPPFLYRDLKPTKIMRRNSDGELFLVDFGIAKSIRSILNETALGSDGYMPPEQYRGKPEPRSDIYALGATMYHLLSGFTPHFRAEYKPIPEISPELNVLLEKALQCEKQDRFASAAEMKLALERIDSQISPEKSICTDSSGKTSPMPEEFSSGQKDHGVTPLQPPSRKEPEKEGSFSENRRRQSKMNNDLKIAVMALIPMGFLLITMLTYAVIDHKRIVAFLFSDAIPSPSVAYTPPVKSSTTYSVQTDSYMPPSPGQTQSSTTFPSFNSSSTHPSDQPLSPQISQEDEAPGVSTKWITESSRSSSSQLSQEEEVKKVLYDSFAALEEFDIERCLDHYANKLDKYYASLDCDRYTVYRNKLWAMEQCKTISIKPSNFYFEKISDIECVLYFDKEYFQENKDRSKGSFEGKVRARFLFKKQFGEWKIAGEEDIKVY